MCDKKCDNCEYADPVYFKDNENGEFYAYGIQTIVNCMLYNKFIINQQKPGDTMFEASLKISEAIGKYEHSYAECRHGTEVKAWSNNVMEFKILDINDEDKEKLLSDIDQILDTNFTFSHDFYINTHTPYYTVLTIKIRKLQDEEIDDAISDFFCKISEKYGITINYNNFNWEYNEF